MNNTIQLYADKEKKVKAYPITSPDRVVDENGVSIKKHLRNNVKFAVVSEGDDVPEIDGVYDDTELRNKIKNIDTEISDARNGEEKLGDTIRNINEQLDNIAIEIEKPISLNKCDSEMLGAIQNKEGETSFNLLSIPRNKSVTPIKTNFMSCNLVNVFDFSKYNGFLINEPISIETVDEEGIKVECNNKMCGVFYKFNTKIGDKYTIKFKGSSTSENLNVRAFNGDKTSELSKTTLVNGYFVGTFTATTEESNIRIFCDVNFKITEGKVFEGTRYDEVWYIDTDKIPSITKDKIESVGIEQLDFKNINNNSNLINNDKILFLNENKDRFEVPITLERKEYTLFCREYGSNLYIIIKDLQGRDIKILSDNNTFIGNNGLKFTSELHGDYILFVRVNNASLEKTKGSWVLTDKEIIMSNNFAKESYTLEGLTINSLNTDFIKKYNIKPKLWKEGQYINKDGSTSPNNNKKWFHAEEILPNTHYYLSPNTLNPVIFYNEQGSYIEGLLIQSTLNTNDMVIFKTPKDAKYVRGVADIGTDLSNMIFCPTLPNKRVSMDEANREILNPNLLPPIPKEKIGSVGVEQLDFVNKKISSPNLINNDKITFLTGNKDSFEVPITLEKKNYRLSCRHYGANNIYISFKNLQGTIVQSLIDGNLFNGNNGLKFTSELQGDYILSIQVNNASLEETKGNWLLTNNELNLADTTFKEEYILNDFPLSSKNIDFDFIKNYNIKPRIWKEGQAIGNGGGASPNTNKKWFFAEEILSDVYYYLSPNTLESVAFYDEQGNYIEWLHIQSTLNNNDMIIFKTPKNAKYVQGTTNISTNLTNMVFCPTIHHNRVSLEEADKKILNPKLYTQHKPLTRYEGMKLVTDGDSLVAMSRWQGYVTDNTGMVLLKNCGIGGTKVTSMCSDERVNAIPLETQVLMLLGGTNDFGQTNNATPLGTIDSPHDNKTFYGAYQLWLDKLIARLPNAIIVILIPPHRKDEYQANHLGLYIEDYRKAIREVAYKYGMPVADLRAKMGANIQNIDAYLEDVVHFNREVGGKKVGEIATATLLGIEPFYV